MSVGSPISPRVCLGVGATSELSKQNLFRMSTGFQEPCNTVRQTDRQTDSQTEKVDRRRKRLFNLVIKTKVVKNRISERYTERPTASQAES